MKQDFKIAEISKQESAAIRTAQHYFRGKMKYEIKDYKVVQFEDFNDSINEFLKEQFGQLDYEFDCVSDLEMWRGSRREFVVEAKIPDKYQIIDLKKGGYSRGISDLLDWMCAYDRIPPGHYLVEVHY